MPSHADLNLSRITAVGLDVDGVLTDGGFYWGPDGQEWKRFCFADVMGVSLARKRGLRFALISGEDSPLVDRFARKMGIEDVHTGCKDKGAGLRQWMVRRRLSREQVCFMGDDVNDLPAMAEAGLSAAPAGASAEVRAAAAIVTTRPGGDGAVRELLDALARGSLHG